MIAKNESHCIEETLESVIKKVKNIGYILLNDTGSIDGTQDIVKNFIKKHNLKGEVINHEMRTCTCHKGKYKLYPEHFHFGWNRNYSIENIYGKSDYILFMDADDIIDGIIQLPNKPKADVYQVMMKSDGSDTVYLRKAIVKNNKIFDWQYHDGLHELLISKAKGDEKLKIENIQGGYIISRRLGARSFDPQKYLNDALFFERMIEREGPTNHRLCYCGRSYKDAKQYDKAIEYFEKRIKFTQLYPNEVWSAKFEIGNCMWWSEAPEEAVIAAYLRAWKADNERIEPIYNIMIFLEGKQKYEEALKYSKTIKEIKYPTKNLTFVQAEVYTYKFRQTVADLLAKSRKIEDALKIYFEIRNGKKYAKSAEDILDKKISWCIFEMRA